ncbi:hypothetical protein SEA_MEGANTHEEKILLA_248 [Streptomyces phage MeganTheeKilla]|uniref:Uncharacterized protein n=1 Tax=Streptomyces phage MeganTheeKilla TaxID=2801897 RepID=A0A7U0GCC7_9CAUD|nr:hypothetical protein SEA_MEGANTHEEKILLA_248 [Streptomyces phage MeganTheeKilla]
MFNRKKYRKGKKYTYVVSGTFSSGEVGPVQDKHFLMADTLLITNSMNALEMFNEVLRHVKIGQKVESNHPVLLKSYHVERN